MLGRLKGITCCGFLGDGHKRKRKVDGFQAGSRRAAALTPWRGRKEVQGRRVERGWARLSASISADRPHHCLHPERKEWALRDNQSDGANESESSAQEVSSRRCNMQEFGLPFSPRRELWLWQALWLMMMGVFPSLWAAFCPPTEVWRSPTAVPFAFYLTWPPWFVLLCISFFFFYFSLWPAVNHLSTTSTVSAGGPWSDPLSPGGLLLCHIGRKHLTWRQQDSQDNKTKTSSGPDRVTARTCEGRFLHFRVLKMEFQAVLQLNHITETSWKKWKNQCDEPDDRLPPATDTHSSNFCTVKWNCVCVVLCWLVQLIQAQSSPIHLGQRRTDHQHEPLLSRPGDWGAPLRSAPL